jgi:glycosyltransferase involved in cell wall biosynthesis
MKIVYLANVRMPTEKAHGLQIMKMCEAFARAGHEVELVVTDRATAITESPFAYYGVEERFAITRLPVIDTVSRGRLGFLVSACSFGLRARGHVRRIRPDCVYGRDELPLWFVLGLAPVVWETHTGSITFFARRVLARARLVVAITAGLRGLYAETTTTPVIVAHDGVDLDVFSRPEEQRTARARLGLPVDARIALYAGRLDGWKGVEVLFKVARLLPDVHIAVIGGEDTELEVLRKQYPEISFLGPRPYTELPDNQAAADVLVLTGDPRSRIAERYTSPLKLFTYMASGKPIAAIDLPAIREVLTPDAASFFTYDPESCAAAIRDSLGAEGAAHAAKAHELVKSYSWDARARTILAALS